MHDIDQANRRRFLSDQRGSRVPEKSVLKQHAAASPVRYYGADRGAHAFGRNQPGEIVDVLGNVLPLRCPALVLRLRRDYENLVSGALESGGNVEQDRFG